MCAKECLFRLAITVRFFVGILRRAYEFNRVLDVAGSAVKDVSTNTERSESDELAKE